MSRRDTFHEAMEAILDHVAHRAGWGQPLIVTELARGLGLSPTPVREALARLSGEGVIDHHSGRGYFAPSLVAGDMTDLYDLHRLVVERASMAVEGAPVGVLCSVLDPIARVEGLFAAVVARARKPVLARSHRGLALRLRPLRVVEMKLRPDYPAEVDGLISLYEADGNIRAASRDFHRRSSGLALQIFEAMRDRS